MVYATFGRKSHRLGSILSKGIRILPRVVVVMGTYINITNFGF